MVCKECGAYNAENLTHCRVCAAKLRDGDNMDMNENEILEGNDQIESKPSRRFAKAPAWPAKAFEGAKDPKSFDEEIIPEVKEENEFVSDRYSFRDEPEEEMDGTKIFKAVKETVEPAAWKPVCSACGKELLEGAPFCPYCGTKVEKDAVAAAAAPVAAAPAAAAAFDFFKNKGEVEEDYDDFDEEEEILPAKEKKKFSLFSKKTKEEDDYFDDEDEEEDDIEEFEPVKKKKEKKLFGRAKKAKEEELEEEYDEDEEDIEEDDEEEYDDEYYDREFDDDEDEPKKKKGSTILFIILIVVLLALIAFFGTYIANKNFGGISNMISSLTGKGTPVEEDQNQTPEINTANPDEVSATIEDDEVDGVEMFIITVQAPNGSVVKLVTNADLEQDSVTVQQDNQVALRVPRVIFLPGDDEYDSTTVTVLPQLMVTLPDGTEKEVYVPAATVTIPQVSLMVTKPESTTVEATPDNSPIDIEGSVEDHTVTVTVNDQPVQVMEGGLFSAQYTPTNTQGEEIRIVARKTNCMQAVQTISVTPYVVKDMAITITSTELKMKDGACTIEGTVPAGTTLSASCDNPNLTMEEPVITDTGFTIKCKASEEGVYNVTINGTCEGYTDGTVTCAVESPATLRASKYKKAAFDASKNYDKLVSGEKTETQLKFKGKIKEVVEDPTYKIFTMEDSDGHIVYVCCRSEKFEVSSQKIGKKVTAGGFNNGLYPGTSCPYIWAWYIWTE